MKKYIVLTLLCIGIVSVGAIAASLNDSVRTLSQTEKANVIAGILCHRCVACRTNLQCNSPGTCSSPGQVCGMDLLAVNDKCVSGPPLLGGCSDSAYQKCSEFKDCYCRTDPPNWTCSAEAPQFEGSMTYSKDPC